MSADKPSPVRRLSAELPVGPMGGVLQTFLMRPTFPGNDPRNRMPVAGAPGKYRVRITLQRPATLTSSEYEISLNDDADGDSYIAIAPPALTATDGQAAPINIRLRTGDGSDEIIIDGFPNKSGFLSHFFCEFRAQSFGDADARALRLIAPCLSAWAVLMDVPMVISRTQITELESSAIAASFVAPFEASRAVSLPELSAEFRTIASFYREALNSRSPVYEFLCFYKIAEAISAQRQARVERAKREGSTPRQPSEILPASDGELVDWLSKLYPAQKRWDLADREALVPTELRGRKINDVLAKDMRPLRNDVAHGLWSDQNVGTLVLDEALHLRRVLAFLPALRLIVRRMIKTDFEEFRRAFPDA
jgi:hypothetical protein